MHGVSGRHTAGLEYGKNAGKSGHGGLDKHRPQHRNPHQERIPHISALGCSKIIAQSHRHADRDAKGKIPVLDQKLIHQHANLCGKGNRHAGSEKNIDEPGDDECQQNEKRSRQEDNDDHRVLKGRLDVGPDFIFMFDDVGQTVEHLRKRTAGLSGTNHAAVKRRKHTGMPAESFIEAEPFLYVPGHGMNDLF